MSVPTLLTKLRADGFTVTCDGGRLLVSPRERLTNVLRDAIRIAKLEILEALRTESQAPAALTHEARIRRMAKRWNYSVDELEAELKRAVSDPVRALSWVAHDEAKFGTGEVLDVRH